MAFPLGISDSQKKQPPLPPAVVSQSDSGSGRDFDNGANYLTFQDTPFTGKLPIIDYTVTAVSTDGLDTVEQTVNTLGPLVLTGLKSGKSYRFKVRARNLVFNSAFSSEFGPGTATTVPGRTTSVGATNSGNGGGATLSWSAPSNGGKSITSYLITPNIGAPIETGNASTSYTFSGLTVGNVYNYTVAARNENGLGQASTTSNAITITAPVVTPPPPIGPTGGGGCTVQPVTITGASLTALNSLGLYEVSLSGSGINLQPPTNVSVGGGNAYNLSYTSTTVTGQIAGLSAGTTYPIQFYNGCTPLTPATPFNVTAPTYSTGGTVTPPPPAATTDCSGANCNNLAECQVCTSPSSYTNQLQNTALCPSGQGYFDFCYTPGTCANIGPTLVSCYTAPSPPPPATSSYTYCVTLGYAVLTSGYPDNCPGISPPPASITPPPASITPPPATSGGGGCAANAGFPCRCTGGCYGERNCAGGCDCSGCTTVTPPATPPPPTTPPATGGSTPPGITPAPPATPPATPPTTPPRGGGCLVSTTLISTPNGFVQAKDIKVGDIVHSVKFAELSTDETVDTIMNWSTGVLTPLELTTSTITAIVTEKQVDYYLSLNGDLMTPEHPVLVRHDGIHSFMQAGDIHLGYEVLKRTGEAITDLEWVPVTSNDFIEAPETVYLFDAEDDDVLFTANMLTHNFKL